MERGERTKLQRWYSQMFARQFVQIIARNEEILQRHFSTEPELSRKYVHSCSGSTTSCFRAAMVQASFDQSDVIVRHGDNLKADVDIRAVKLSKGMSELDELYMR